MHATACREVNRREPVRSLQACRMPGTLQAEGRLYTSHEKVEQKTAKEGRVMLFGYLIDFLCEIIVAGLLVVAVGLFVSFIIIMIGEKMKWW